MSWGAALQAIDYQQFTDFAGTAVGAVDTWLRPEWNERRQRLLDIQDLGASSGAA